MFLNLPDLLVVIVPACSAIGTFAGIWMKGDTWREVGENIIFGSSIGGIVGTVLSFAVWLGAQGGHA